LREINPDTSLELITAGSGDWTVRKNYLDGSHRFLHSSIDPREEARVWTGSQRVILPSLIIIGVGLAYHVFELLQNCKNFENVYLIEADERLFQLAMKVHDFSSLIHNASVHFLIAPPLTHIEKIFSTSITQPFSCHIFFPVVSSCLTIYNPIKELIEMHLYTIRLRKQDDDTPDYLPFPKGVEYLLDRLSTP